MSSYTILPNGKQQFITSNGTPLAGGKVYYYIPSTTTFKNTYQDAAGVNLNTNPVILDANGQCIVYGQGSYRQQVFDVNNNLIWDQQVDSPLNQTDFINFQNSLASSTGSSLIGYNEGATGATTITVQAKLQQTVSVKDFGAVGDWNGSTGTDNTTYIQNAIDYCISAGKALFIPAGNYLTGPLNLNGTGHATPANSNWQALSSLYGEGREVSVFYAKTTGFSSGQYIITGNNLASVEYKDFGVNGNNVQGYGIDFSWAGGSGGNPSAAPSNQNIFENIYVTGCQTNAMNLNQNNDSKISGLRLAGVTNGNYALYFNGSGGMLACDDVWIGGGIFQISAQNAGITNCGFFGGVELAGASYNTIVFTGCQLYSNTVSTIVINSSAYGNANRGVCWIGCYFNPDSYFISGRYWQGMTFIDCQFMSQTISFFNTAGMSAAAGSGSPPTFTFQGCSFEGTTPAKYSGVYNVRILSCRNSSGVTIDDYGNFYNSGTFQSTANLQNLGNAVVISGQQLSLAPSGTLTLNMSSGAFILTVLSFNVSSAANRTSSVYFVGTFQQNGFAANLLSTDNGTSSGASFTVTNPTTSTLVITNTSSYTVNMSASLFGVGG